MLFSQIKPTTNLDPRIKRTRKLLLQAFNELLAEKDFSALTVQDVASRAEVNRATFYAHFEDKFDLLDYSVRQKLLEKLKGKLPDGAQLTPANLRTLIVAVTEFVGEYVSPCNPRTHGEMQLRIGAQVQLYLSELLLSWLTDESPRDDKAATVAAGISYFIFGTVIQSLTTRARQSPGELANTIIAFLEPSLSGYFAGQVDSPHLAT